MDLISQLVFLAGVLFQCVLMMRNFYNEVNLKKLILGSLAVFILTLLSSLGGQIEMLIFNFAIFLAAGFTFIFRNKIISFLDERVFIFFNLLVIYFLLFVSNFLYQLIVIFSLGFLIILYFSMKKYKTNLKQSKKIYFLGSILIIPLIIFSIFMFSIYNFSAGEFLLLKIFSIVIPIFFIISSSLKKVYSDSFQGVSYLWYLIIILIIEVFVFIEIYAKIIFGENIPIYIFFFLGSSIAYLTVLVVNIFLSLPLMGEDTPIEESMKMVYESIVLFSEKFQDYQVSLKQISIIFFISIILFFLLYFAKIISFEYFVIIVVPVLVFIFRVRN